MSGKLFVFEEVRPARIEHFRNVRSKTNQKDKQRRQPPKERILQKYFETVFIGTQQRRKDETQRCCICGEISVAEGKPTGHALTHHK